MTEILHVENRTTTGKRRNRRMRDAGQLPAILYGHREEPVSLTLKVEEMAAALRHGVHLVELAGAASGQALLQDVQWDVFQQHVLHVDLLRVDASERITVEVPIHTRGESPGVLNGGLLEHHLHSIEIETSPVAIPDVLHVNINHLGIGQELRVSDIIDMPAGAVPQCEPTSIVVACVMPGAEVEAEPAVAGAAEPEVIGKAEKEAAEE
ncbi:MAG: 50S ribosomal protein L25 [Pirellulales bacterium]|nr:50S ribosomal protein L25 [Pirellulales bacterium]